MPDTTVTGESNSKGTNRTHYTLQPFSRARPGQSDSRAVAKSKVRLKPRRQDGGKKILTSPMPQVGAVSALPGGRRSVRLLCSAAHPVPSTPRCRCRRLPRTSPGPGREAAAPVTAPPCGGRGPGGAGGCGRGRREPAGGNAPSLAGTRAEERAGSLGRGMPSRVRGGGRAQGSRRRCWGCCCREAAT